MPSPVHSEITGHFSIGQRLATSRRAMVMLNHFSRTGTDSHSRRTEPKPAQVETLGS